jgi:ATP-binding cassette subfamily E protein 1
VLGIVGTNGIGKSTALSILAGRLMPNLGRLEEQPSWQEIVSTFRQGELPQYFERALRGEAKVMIKPQYVDRISKQLGGKVGTTLEMKDDSGRLRHVSEAMELDHLHGRCFTELSGGELQRFAITLMCIQDAHVYMFDEPSSFLDVKQRLQAAHTIRELLTADKYILVVEHDLSVLDYLSDFVCCLWGSAGAYGVVTMPFSVREGINIFLDGKIPTENLRFREVALTFKISEQVTEIDEEDVLSQTSYPSLKKTMGANCFELEVEGGHFSRSEIIVMLGQNGCGKTTFIKMLAGLLAPDGKEKDDLPQLNVSYKPQSITAKFHGTVRDLFLAKIGDAISHPQFQADVAKPMLMDPVLDRTLQSLSGGELQRVALVLTLGRPADIYLIDEPSAYLDAEQRIVAARVIKQFVLTTRASAFIVEHDFIMATYLADRVIVYSGRPGVSCKASAPQHLVDGMNKFLAQLGITFRRDPSNFRPRINKIDSIKDREQRESGQFFTLEA